MGIISKFYFHKGQISARGTAYSPCCAAINRKRRSASAFCKSTPSRECSVQNRNLRKSRFEHLLIKLDLRRRIVSFAVVARRSLITPLHLKRIVSQSQIAHDVPSQSILLHHTSWRAMSIKLLWDNCGSIEIAHRVDELISLRGVP